MLRLISVWFLISLFISNVHASDQEAYRLFEAGKKSYELKDYDAAIDWFNMALEHRSYDGQVKIKTEEALYQWLDTPRGPRRVEVSDGMNYVEYYPNDYLAKSIDGQQRLAKQANPPRLSLTYDFDQGAVMEEPGGGPWLPHCSSHAVNQEAGGGDECPKRESEGE